MQYTPFTAPLIAEYTPFRHSSLASHDTYANFTFRLTTCTTIYTNFATQNYYVPRHAAENLYRSFEKLNARTCHIIRAIFHVYAIIANITIHFARLTSASTSYLFKIKMNAGRRVAILSISFQLPPLRAPLPLTEADFIAIHTRAAEISLAIRPLSLVIFTEYRILRDCTLRVISLLTHHVNSSNFDKILNYFLIFILLA
jgi:hypothetical protein